MRTAHDSRLVDATLEDSFPASDPPSWTASVAMPAAPDTMEGRASGSGEVRRPVPAASF
jgi:hypothetical protein